MNDDTSYIREEDRQEYRKFCQHHIPSFARPLPKEIWHYTTAEGLIGILETGKIWATQSACLNDTLEQRYFGDKIHEVVKAKRKTNTDPRLNGMLALADEALLNRNFSTAGLFVTCFSEQEDDLGQWRGYGGGECGYAIGFDTTGINKAIARRNGTLLLPMNYDEQKQDFLVADVVHMAEQYFLQRLAQGITDTDKLAKDFIIAFAQELDIFACIIKHPKFVSEGERRIAAYLQPNEYNLLEFRQKRTLLARHLPIDLTILHEDKNKLPITRIYVGPSPSQQVTKISVGDLLLKFGYKGITVETSKAPYRVP